MVACRAASPDRLPRLGSERVIGGWAFMCSCPARWRRAVNSPDTDSRNRLVAALSPADRALLTPYFHAIALDARQILETPHEPISPVYFVYSGLVSVGASARHGPHLRCRTI